MKLKSFIGRLRPFISRAAAFIARRATCLLALLLATAPAFAQMEVCAGQGFMLTSKVDAQSISGGVTYTWHESFNDDTPSSIPNSNTPALAIAAGKSAAGTYKYVRWVASDACPGGVPSNTFTVVVNVNPSVSISPSATIRSEYSTVTFTAIASDCSGCTYNWSSDGATAQSISVSAPSDGSAATYSCTVTNSSGCTAASQASVTGAPPTPKDSGTQTWVVSKSESNCSGAQTWSGPLTNAHAGCTGTIMTGLVTGSGYLYNWYCVHDHGDGDEWPDVLCPTPWRVPTPADYCLLLKILDTSCSCPNAQECCATLCNALVNTWGAVYSGFGTSGKNTNAYYWTSNEVDTSQGWDFHFNNEGTVRNQRELGKSAELQLRCVK